MKIIKNKKHMISFLLKNISCTCFVYLLILANAHAFPQKKDIHKKTLKTKIQLSFIPENTPENITENKITTNPDLLNTIESEQKSPLNIAIKTKSTSSIDFNKLRPKNKIKQIKDHYLTFYLGKKDKLKATYLQGSYAINYSQSW